MADVQQHDHEVNAQEVDAQEVDAQEVDYEWLSLWTAYAEEIDGYKDVPVDPHIEKASRQKLQNHATRQDMHKWYNVLGLHKHAKPTAKDIKDAYRRCAKQRHPDRCTGDKEEFQKLGEAYDILGNSELKKLYDWRGSRGVTQHQAKEFRKKAEDTEGGGILAALFSFIGFDQG